MNEHSCGNCYFAQPITREVKGEIQQADGVVQCCRFPPQILLAPKPITAEERLSGRPIQQAVELAGRSPVMLAGAWGCGEFSARGVNPTQPA